MRACFVLKKGVNGDNFVGDIILVKERNDVEYSRLEKEVFLIFFRVHLVSRLLS